MSEQQTSDRLYKQGVEALRAGDKAAARAKLLQAVQADRTHEQAWLWLSAAVETDEEKITCLQNALTLNPGNDAARRGLEKLGAGDMIDAGPSGFSDTPPDTSPDPYIQPPVRMEHGSSRIAETLWDSPSSRKKSSTSGDELWRQALYEPDPEAENSALFLRDHAPPEPRTWLDLVNSWGNLVLFRTGEDFQAELDQGGFMHSMVSIVAGGLLQTITLVVMILIFSTLSRTGSQLPLIRSLTATLPPETVAELGLSDMNILGELGAGGIGILGLGLVGTAVLSIPILFLGSMFESFIIDQVASRLGGHGDVIKTLQAITLALVAQQLVQIPILIFLPFMTFNLAALIFGGYVVYQIVLKAIAVGKAQDFGILISLGVLIISSSVGSMASCAAGFVLTLLLGSRVGS